MTTTNQAEKFCSLNLMLFPALLICICRLKLLGIECLRPFWALWIRGLGAQHSSVGARRVRVATLASLLARSSVNSAPVCSWPASKQFAADQLQSVSKHLFYLVAAPVSSWWVIADENLGEAVNSFRLQSLWTGTFHHGPKAQGTPLMILGEMELESGIMSLLSNTRKNCNSSNN